MSGCRGCSTAPGDADPAPRRAQVVIFAVPGAFTPTCSLKHLPGFIEKADELKAKGVETIACVAVNDAFVMDAWGKSVDAGDKVMLLADGSALFTKVRARRPPSGAGLGGRACQTRHTVFQNSESQAARDGAPAGEGQGPASPAGAGAREPQLRSARVSNCWGAPVLE